jgi:hypothetical protein
LGRDEPRIGARSLAETRNLKEIREGLRLDPESLATQPFISVG